MQCICVCCRLLAPPNLATAGRRESPANAMASSLQLPFFCAPHPDIQMYAVTLPLPLTLTRMSASGPCDCRLSTSTFMSSLSPVQKVRRSAWRGHKVGSQVTACNCNNIPYLTDTYTLAEEEPQVSGETEQPDRPDSSGRIDHRHNQRQRAAWLGPPSRGQRGPHSQGGCPIGPHPAASGGGHARRGGHK